MGFDSPRLVKCYVVISILLLSLSIAMIVVGSQVESPPILESPSNCKKCLHHFHIQVAVFLKISGGILFSMNFIFLLKMGINYYQDRNASFYDSTTYEAFLILLAVGLAIQAFAFMVWGNVYIFGRGFADGYRGGKGWTDNPEEAVCKKIQAIVEICNYCPKPAFVLTYTYTIMCAIPYGILGLFLVVVLLDRLMCCFCNYDDWLLLKGISEGAQIIWKRIKKICCCPPSLIQSPNQARDIETFFEGVTPTLTDSPNNPFSSNSLHIDSSYREFQDYHRDSRQSHQGVPFGNNETMDLENIFNNSSNNPFSNSLFASNFGGEVSGGDIVPEGEYPFDDVTSSNDRRLNETAPSAPPPPQTPSVPIIDQDLPPSYDEAISIHSNQPIKRKVS